MALTPPAAQARPRLEGHPKPPSQAQINAAENQVRQHQAALGTEQGKLSATNTSDPSTIHHVAIYIGNGMMVNAPYTGAFVRIDSMYAPGGLIGAVRPAG
jgi:cell wall-associated NlpC family hydrolase